MKSKTDKTIADFKHEAKKIVARIGRERDALRALMSEYQDILESVEDSKEELTHALDRLSEYL